MRTLSCKSEVGHGIQCGCHIIELIDQWHYDSPVSHVIAITKSPFFWGTRPHCAHHLATTRICHFSALSIFHTVLLVCGKGLPLIALAEAPKFHYPITKTSLVQNLAYHMHYSRAKRNGFLLFGDMQSTTSEANRLGVNFLDTSFLLYHSALPSPCFALALQTSSSRALHSLVQSSTSKLHLRAVLFSFLLL